MGALKDSLRDVYVLTFGNRVTLTGLATMAAGSELVVHAGIFFTNQPDISAQLMAVSIGFGALGGGMVGGTYLGTTALKNYRIVRKSIRKTGRLDKRIIKKILGKEL